MKKIALFLVAFLAMAGTVCAQKTDSSTFVVHYILNKHLKEPEMFNLYSIEDHHANTLKYIKYVFEKEEIKTFKNVTYSDLSVLKEEFTDKDVLCITLKTKESSDLSGKYYFKLLNEHFVPMKKEPY